MNFTIVRRLFYFACDLVIDLSFYFFFNLKHFSSSYLYILDYIRLSLYNGFIYTHADLRNIQDVVTDVILFMLCKCSYGEEYNRYKNEDRYVL